MAHFKYIAMMILAEFFTLIHAFDSPQTIRERKLTCITDIGQFFNLPISPELRFLVGSYDNPNVEKAVNEYLNTEACAKIAIMSLKDYGFGHATYRNSFYGYNYYKYFNKYLNSEGIKIPINFCTNHIRSLSSEEISGFLSEEVSVLHLNHFETRKKQKIIEERCMKNLNGFTNKQKEILEDAFYNYNMHDFERNYFGKLYMELIHDTFLLYPLDSPAQYCHNEVMQSLYGVRIHDE